MSLINKMLQDLDARGQQSGAEMQPSVKSVARRESKVSLPLAGGLLLLAVVVALAGVFGWRYVKRPAPVPVPRMAAVAPPAATPVPVQQLATPAAVVPEAVVPAVPAPAAAKPASAPVEAKAAVAAPPVESTPAQHAAAKAPAKPTRKEKRAQQARLAAEKKAADAKAAAAKTASSKPRAAAVTPAAGGRQLTTQQRAESEYRRALASLAEGRGAEAIAGLEQALQIEPRHDAARQTLVGLFIENKRADDAMRQLQLGLTLDPRQPSLAMLLARLQIEHGGSGIDTLTRTLPYAAGSGEYHAFLAGALQREARHREAAEQYQQALHAAPQNGVWWMGLGISLQAEKRNAEALDAFQKSKAAGSLTPELGSFVDRKLQQLSR